MGPVKITHEKEGQDARLTLTDGDMTMRLMSRTSPEDFPDMNRTGLDDAVRLSMTHDELARQIRLSGHCISNEETRYYLNGLFLTRHPENRTLRAVSTDGHRMAVIDTEEKVGKDIAAIVPKSAVDLALSLLEKGANEPVGIAIADTKFGL